MEQDSEGGEQVSSRPPPGAPSPAVPLSHAVSLMSPLVAVVQLTVLLSSDAKVVGGRACTPGLKRSGMGIRTHLYSTSYLSSSNTLNTHPFGYSVTPSLLTTLLVEW